MSNVYMGILILIVTALALVLIAVGARMPTKQVTIEERLAAFAERPRALEELELERPFSERVLQPMFRSVTRKLARFTPKANREKVKQLLLEAGSPNNLGATEFMGLRAVMGLLLGGTAFLIVVFTGSTLKPISVLGLPIPGILSSRARW